jgi:hypothetical protein
LVAAFFLVLFVVAQHWGYYVSMAVNFSVAFLFFIDRRHYPKWLTARQIRWTLTCAVALGLVVFVAESNINPPAKVLRSR